MDIEHRMGFIGIGMAALALVATQTDLLPLSLSNLIPFGRNAEAEMTRPDQRGRELMLERNLDVRPGGTLAVELDDADVTVRAETTNQATIKVFMSASDRNWGREVFDRMDFEASLRGTELSVSSQHPRFDRSEWRDGRGNVNFHVEITMPSSFGATISTADGDVSMGDFEGEFDLKTSDGDISVGALAGTIYLETSDGDVSADRLSGETISVRTSDGDVTVNTLTGPAAISTSDGDISIGLENSVDVTLRTGDGDVTIYADEALRASLDFNGESVELGAGFTLDDGRVTEHGIEGDLNGGGPVVQVHTGDGAISMIDRGRDR